MTITILLSPSPADSLVLLDGTDITKSVRSLVIEADAQSQPVITLQIVGRVDVLGEATVVMIAPEDQS